MCTGCGESRTSRISVVYSGFEIAAPFTAPGSALAVLTGTRFVLSPYNLEPRKNLRALLIAMAHVRRTHPDLRLILYGHAAVTPDRERDFHKDLSELGLKDAVVRTGFISDEELASFYSQSALFVFPSLYEGFGIPVLEAMAAGACVIARNQSAMREILGETGAQVETKDPAQLAACISSLLDDPVRRAELGRAAQMRAAQFTPDAMAQGTLAAYARALARQ